VREKKSKLSFGKKITFFLKIEQISYSYIKTSPSPIHKKMDVSSFSDYFFSDKNFTSPGFKAKLTNSVIVTMLQHAESMKSDTTEEDLSRFDQYLTYEEELAPMPKPKLAKGEKEDEDAVLERHFYEGTEKRKDKNSGKTVEVSGFFDKKKLCSITPEARTAITLLTLSMLNEFSEKLEDEDYSLSDDFLQDCVDHSLEGESTVLPFAVELVARFRDYLPEDSGDIQPPPDSKKKVTKSGSSLLRETTEDFVKKFVFRDNKSSKTGAAVLAVTETIVDFTKCLGILFMTYHWDSRVSVNLGHTLGVVRTISATFPETARVGEVMFTVIKQAIDEEKEAKLEAKKIKEKKKEEPEEPEEPKEPKEPPKKEDTSESEEVDTDAIENAVDELGFDGDDDNEKIDSLIGDDSGESDDINLDDI
jgi:hypothetical protein